MGRNATVTAVRRSLRLRSSLARHYRFSIDLVVHDEEVFVVDESNVRVLGDGSGVVLTTPDGSGRYLLRVDNDGKLVTEVVDEDGGDE